MRLADAALPWFARHETFHPRYGWFRKAYTETARNSDVFGRDDAPVVIGVGKNMVRAIRFWGLAAKLITNDPESPNRRAPGYIPTWRGHALFGEQGWDPYMEDPGTLWLLHWLLLAPCSCLPVWWSIFNEFDAVEFDEADLEAAIAIHLEAVAEWRSPHPSSVKKDLGAFLRTYAPAEQSGRVGFDDLVDCPLRELSLLRRSPATGRYRFTLGPKPTLPSEIVAHAALDYVARTVAGGSTVTLSRLAHEAGSPGRAFKLSEAELLAVLTDALARTDGADIMTPTGASQLVWSEDPAITATAILDDYYGSAAPRICAGPEGDEAVSKDVRDNLWVQATLAEPMSRARALSGQC